MKKFLICLMIAVLVLAYRWNSYAEETLCCPNCSIEVNSNFCPNCGLDSSGFVPALSDNEAILTLNISYEKNKLLAKYDISVQLDGSYIGTISQDETLSETLTVKKGVHEISLLKDGSAMRTIMINAQESEQFSCTLKAHMLSLEMIDVVNTNPATDEDLKAYYIIRDYSNCPEIDYEHICRYPENYSNKPLYLKGRVIATSENFAGAMKVIVKDSHNDLWIIEYSRQTSQPRLLINDVISIYGHFKGITTYTSSVDTYPNLPTLALEYMYLN